jgi:hypothetical protein
MLLPHIELPHLAKSINVAGVVFLSFQCLAESDKLSFDMVDQSVLDQVILRRQSYDYAPAIIYDGAQYRLYWCAGVAGDFVLHAEAFNPAGPWHSSRVWRPNSFDVALQPTDSPTTFDGLHTCDPNIIKVDGNYYMYYGGAAADGALGAIGVALSKDGIHFTRLNGGRPIVTAARTNSAYKDHGLTYGAGQPAILYRRPYFYMSFTDSTGFGSNPGNGAGQFLLRSVDPTFQSGTQEWTKAEWAEREPGQHTAEFSYLESFGIDWMIDALTSRIIVASNRWPGTTTLYLLDPDTFAVIASSELPTHWREGPALITQSDKSALPRKSCDDLLPIGVVTAEGPSTDPSTWDLALSIGKFRISPCMNTFHRP